VVFGSLEELSGDVSQDWSSRLFSYDGSVFSIDLSQEVANARIILGLRGLSEQDLVSWMNGALIGTRGVWTALSERRVLGAARRRIDDAPEFGIRSGSGYILFAVEINDQFILPDQDLVINNLAVLPSIQRSIEIVLFAKG
jgi:type VI secretion system protein ImpJ